tara:strand:- start:2229 stop:2366 length:138 start_codon:yes stop_codon:yes gene_type:complete
MICVIISLQDNATVYGKAGRGTATVASLNLFLKNTSEVAIIKYDL